MTILFLDQFDEVGGAQRSLLELAPALREAGAETHAGLPGDGPFAKRLRARGAHVHSIPLRPYSAGHKSLRDAAQFLADLWPLAKRIRELAEELNAAVVYVNGPRLMPAAALARVPQPVIFHAHSELSALNGRHLAAAAVLARRASVIAATQRVAKQWGERARVVYGGVEGPPAGWRRAPKAASPRIGLIGRFEPGKGQREFVLAAAALAAGLPEAEFWLCGDARAGDAAAQRYKDKVVALSPSQVKHLGWQDDVYEVLAHLDLLVVPSVSEGGIPYVVLDAFAARVPVLATPAGDLEQVIENGVNGFLLRSASPREIARRLRELLDEPGRLETAATNAHSLWRRRFTAARFRREIWKTIQQAAQARRS